MISGNPLLRGDPTQQWDIDDDAVILQASITILHGKNHGDFHSIYLVSRLSTYLRPPPTVSQ